MLSIIILIYLKIQLSLFWGLIKIMLVKTIGILRIFNIQEFN
jgi:hypothetical protein